MMLELAKQWGLRSDEGLAYGIYCGYVLTLIPGDARCLLSITTRLEGCAPRPTWEQRQTFGIRRFCRREFSLLVEFASDDTLPQRLREFVPGFLARLSDLGAAKAAVCPVCGRPVMGRHPWLLIHGAACHLHPECMVELERRSRKGLQAFSAPGNWATALLGGSLGGLLGALLWIALAVGWSAPTLASPLIPCLVWLGWIWGEGRRDWMEIWGVAALSLGSLLAAAGLTWLFQPIGLELRLTLGAALIVAMVLLMYRHKRRRWEALNHKPRPLA